MSSGEDGRRSRGRRHWRIVLLIPLGLVLLAVAAWRIAGSTFEARLQARIDEYRRLGQPATLADLKPAPVDPSDNAALALKEAARLIVLDRRQELVADRPNPQWLQEQPEMLAEIVRINVPAIQKAHQARAMKGVDWELDYSSFVALTNSSMGLSKTRSLCYLLASTAHWEAQAGQDSESVACVRDILRAGRIVNQIPSLTGDLTHTAITSLACRTVEGAMPYWDLSDPQTRQGAEALLKELLDESDFFAAGERAWLGGRAATVDLLLNAPRGRFCVSLEYLEDVLKAPLYQRDLLRELDNDTQMAEAVTQPSYPQAVAMLPPSVGTTRVSRFLRPLSSIGENSWPKVVTLRYSALDRRRLAAAGLAMAMFRADHGAEAKELTALVPQYLPAVLTDPFSAEGAPIRLAGDEPARVYSVNLDGVDDGGHEGKTIDSGDVAFYLAGGRKWPLDPNVLQEVARLAEGSATAPATGSSGPSDGLAPQE